MVLVQIFLTYMTENCRSRLRPPGAVGLVVDPDRFGEDGHGEDVEVGLAAAAHVHVHVLAGVVAAQHRQRVVGANYELEEKQVG